MIYKKILRVEKINTKKNPDFNINIRSIKRPILKEPQRIDRERLDNDDRITKKILDVVDGASNG